MIKVLERFCTFYLINNNKYQLNNLGRLVGGGGGVGGGVVGGSHGGEGKNDESLNYFMINILISTNISENAINLISILGKTCLSVSIKGK